MQSLSELEKKRERTQAALAQKLGLLEERVFGTVEEAKNTVKRTVDIEYQVKNHPLVTVSLSTLLGYVLGRLWLPEAPKYDSGPGTYRDGTESKVKDSFKVLDEGLGLLREVAPAVISNLVLAWIKDSLPWTKLSGKKGGETNAKS